MTSKFRYSLSFGISQDFGLAVGPALAPSTSTRSVRKRGLEGLGWHIFPPHSAHLTSLGKNITPARWPHLTAFTPLPPPRAPAATPAQRSGREGPPYSRGVKPQHATGAARRAPRRRPHRARPQGSGALPARPANGSQPWRGPGSAGGAARGAGKARTAPSRRPRRLTVPAQAPPPPPHGRRTHPCREAAWARRPHLPRPRRRRASAARGRRERCRGRGSCRPRRLRRTRRRRAGAAGRRRPRHGGGRAPRAPGAAAAATRTASSAPKGKGSGSGGARLARHGPRVIARRQSARRLRACAAPPPPWRPAAPEAGTGLRGGSAVKREPEATRAAVPINGDEAAGSEKTVALITAVAAQRVSRSLHTALHSPRLVKYNHSFQKSLWTGSRLQHASDHENIWLLTLLFCKFLNRHLHEGVKFASFSGSALEVSQHKVHRVLVSFTRVPQ